MPLHETDIGHIETREWGDGPELIVLLHAAASSPHALARFAESLARPGRRVIAPMHNRYGQTDYPASDNPIDCHIAVAAACLDLYLADRQIVIGHSMGGLVALLLCLRESRPDALVLYEPIVPDILDRNDPDDMAARDWDRGLVFDIAAKLEAGDPEPGIAAFVEGWNEMTWQAIPEAARQKLIDAAPVFAAETCAVQDYTIDRQALAAMSTPPLILYGSKSPELIHRMTKRLADHIPQSRRVALDGLRHMGPVTKPDLVAAAIEAYLQNP